MQEGKVLTSLIPSIVGIIFFLSFFVSNAYAARSIVISANKLSLFGDEELAVSASLSGFTTNETIYIKGAFFQEGVTNYFGLTKTDISWIKNGESITTQKQIIVGNWDQTLISKVDFSDSGYKGEGNYKFKIGFYYVTSGGNMSSVNWSANILDIAVSQPAPTATLVPTIPPSPTSTIVPSPKPTITKVPTVKIVPSVIITKNAPTSLPTATMSAVLAGSTSATPVQKEKKISQTTKKSIISLLLPVTGGMLFISACGIVGFQIYKKKYIHE